MQVAVGSAFLAYALRGGQVRVLDLLLGTRALLRGHEAPICDMQVRRRARARNVVWAKLSCAPPSPQFCGSELLCTASDDGIVLLRALSMVRHRLPSLPRISHTVAGAQDPHALGGISVVPLLRLDTLARVARCSTTRPPPLTR